MKNKSSKDTERIPFEPNNRSKKAKEAKKLPTAPVVANKSKSKANSSVKQDSQDIPDEVNRRIIRRSALFCGIPTGLGITTFFVSYILVSRHIVDLPTSAVVLLSMLFLGIGVLGLSYGAISASWDEGRIGSWWGGDEFKKNFGHLKEAWKSQQQIVKAAQQSKNQ
ncbi:MAG: DUF3464 domain-containing protein [Pseudanabaena frigida]|uniref:DUF3464 domain-containing protein n=1 Tax=Pseudanabaena frigida TaxID=945775 RepID=A0A2W4VV03_9CYAN|nr:MAG: DUF3464 domain-containing protein [Pseudanabaena frigida]